MTFDAAIEIYKGLNKREQLVMEIFAVTGPKITINTISQALGRVPEAKELIPKSADRTKFVRTMRSKLLKKKILVEESGSTFFSQYSVAAWITKKLLSEKRYESFSAAIDAQNKSRSYNFGVFYEIEPHEFLTALYTGKSLEKFFERAALYYSGYLTLTLLPFALWDPHNGFYLDIVERLPLKSQYFIYSYILASGTESIEVLNRDILRTANAVFAKTGATKRDWLHLFNAYWFLNLTEEAHELAKSQSRGLMQGLLLFAQGSLEEALITTEKDLKTDKDVPEFNHIFYTLMLIAAFKQGMRKAGSYKISPKKIERCLNKWDSNYPETLDQLSYIALEYLYQVHRHPDTRWNPDRVNDRLSPLSWVLCSLASFYANSSLAKTHKQDIKRKLTNENIPAWIRMQLKGMLESTMGRPVEPKHLVFWFRASAKWERQLDALGNEIDMLSQLPDQHQTIEKRIIWTVNFRKFPHGSITAGVQKIGKNGQWLKPTPVSLGHLTTGSMSELLTNRDRRVIETAKAERYGRRAFYEFTQPWLTIAAMAGHPAIYDSQTGEIVKVEVSEPQIVAQDHPDGTTRITFSDNLSATTPYCFDFDNANLCTLTVLDDKTLRLAQIFGHDGIVVPQSGKKRLKKLLASLSTAGIVAQKDSASRTIESCSIPVLRLNPDGEGVSGRFLVKPVHNIDTYVRPGHGRAIMQMKNEKQNLRVKRDLEKEISLLDELVHSSIYLQEAVSEDGTLVTNNFIDTLLILDELKPLIEQSKVRIEWPRGGELKVRARLDSQALSVRVKSQANWFKVDGTVKVSEDQVIELSRLLSNSRNQQQGFIELSDGEYLRITDGLKRQLDQLAASTKTSKEGLEIHPLHCARINDTFKDCRDFQADRGFHNQIANLESMEKFSPKIPRTLRADLRGYQMDGFHWLSRLANWGIGACLADDMGLGKTLQAITVLTDRASLGPAIVVCPVSVIDNWCQEIVRFSPTLTPKVLNDGDREHILNNLKKGDVLILSYQLLVNQIEQIAPISFNAAILDEAQSIKNRLAKRTKAACQLKADFRLALTGTPIENNVSEIWSLFNFLNPGLFYTYKDFETKFFIPIEVNKDYQARKQLKSILDGFILRRTKSTVLQELPPKTEITEKVTPSEEEASFYEAIRRKSLEAIASAGNSNSQQSRFQLLAEIMKLRRAACHPDLVMKESRITSAKLTRLMELLDNLKANQHRVLVFSQFVDHLKLIEKHLRKNRIRYQYLDGSTPPKKRVKAINDFQAGDGEVFLISLKAGGTGLNLTAANYVIHVDPWWNPAVEKQATDRAHRIGQSQPVTIYRLVTAGTIEEKILEIHERKEILPMIFYPTLIRQPSFR